MIDLYEEVGRFVLWYGKREIPNLRWYLVVFGLYVFFFLPLGYLWLAKIKKLDYYRLFVIICSAACTLVVFLLGITTRYDTPFYYYTQVNEVYMDEDEDNWSEEIYLIGCSPYNGECTLIFNGDYALNYLGTNNDNNGIVAKKNNYTREKTQDKNGKEQVEITYSNQKAFGESRSFLSRVSDKKNGLELLSDPFNDSQPIWIKNTEEFPVENVIYVEVKDNEILKCMRIDALEEGKEISTEYIPADTHGSNIIPNPDKEEKIKAENNILKTIMSDKGWNIAPYFTLSAEEQMERMKQIEDGMTATDEGYKVYIFAFTTNEDYVPPFEAQQGYPAYGLSLWEYVYEK